MNHLLTLIGIQLLAAMTPGPDFTLVLKNSLVHGKRAGVITALGIACGISIHLTYCILGLALVITQTPFLFHLLRYLGAAYLIYLGFQAITGKSAPIPSGADKAPKKGLSDGKAFQQGFVCNILNIKAGLFFIGLFSIMVTAETPLFIQLGAGAIMILDTFVWFGFVAMVCGHRKVREKFLGAHVWIMRILGVLLMAFGGMLLL